MKVTFWSSIGRMFFSKTPVGGRRFKSLFRQNFLRYSIDQKPFEYTEVLIGHLQTVDFLPIFYRQTFLFRLKYPLQICCKLRYTRLFQPEDFLRVFFRKKFSNSSSLDRVLFTRDDRRPLKARWVRVIFTGIF